MKISLLKKIALIGGLLILIAAVISTVKTACEYPSMLTALPFNMMIGMQMIYWALLLLSWSVLCFIASKILSKFTYDSKDKKA